MKDEKIEKLKQSAQNILDKNFKILFFVEESDFPSAAIYEIYNQAKILREMGYDAKLLANKSDYKIPEYIDEDMKSLPHVFSEKNTFNITPEDFLIIPELFTNILEQIKHLPSYKIVFLQNFDNSLRGLLPGTTWDEYNINLIITNNKNVNDMISEFFGPFRTKTYTIGIPDYFKKSKKPKSPIISFYARNTNDLTKVIKLFYLKYPAYRFVSFEDLRGNKREDFAKKLSDSMATLWLDRIATFGTVPIEAMKCGTIPIGLIPDIKSEYILDDKDTGFWSNDLFLIPDMIAQFVRLWIQNAIPEKLYQEMDEISSNYDYKKSSETIKTMFEEIFAERYSHFQKFIQTDETK